MIGFVCCYLFWLVIIVVGCVILIWMIFVFWFVWFVDFIGCKKIFLNVFFNGIIFGGFYFFVVLGFILIFGLMCNVNFVYGLFYFLGGYIGYEVVDFMGYWFLVFFVVFIIVGVFGILF